MSRSKNETRVPPRYRRQSRRKSWTERRWKKPEFKRWRKSHAREEIE